MNIVFFFWLITIFSFIEITKLLLTLNINVKLLIYHDQFKNSSFSKKTITNLKILYVVQNFKGVNIIFDTIEGYIEILKNLKTPKLFQISKTPIKFIKNLNIFKNYNISSNKPHFGKGKIE